MAFDASSLVERGSLIGGIGFEEQNKDITINNDKTDKRKKWFYIVMTR